MHLIWPCSMIWLKKTATVVAAVSKGVPTLFDTGTGRDFHSMFLNRDFNGICELLELGKKLNESEIGIVDFLSTAGGTMPEKLKKYFQEYLVQTIPQSNC